MYLHLKYLIDCKEAGYTHEEKHTMWRNLYDMFHMIFPDKDFGFWDDRLARISFFMAIENGISKQYDKAHEELEQILSHIKSYKCFSEISHSSLLVNQLRIDQTNNEKSSEETLSHAYLRYLNNNDTIFAPIKDDSRFVSIKKHLAEF